MEPWIEKISHKILIDDFGKACKEVEILSNKYCFEYIKNATRIGQHASIDRAYKHVKNQYIFHCEDDWEFYNEPNFTHAKSLLNKSEISCVCFRQKDDRSSSKHPNKRLDISRYESEIFLGINYLYLPKNYHQSYGSFTFNPSIIKYDLYSYIGPYSQYKTEKQISEFLKARDKVIAFQESDSCRHIGWNHHADDPKKLPRGYTFISKLKRSWYKRVGFTTRKIKI